MKLKLIILLTTFVFAGCQQLSNLTTPKPVQIDGLGSLVSLKDKSLDEEQLTKIVKTVVKQKRVTVEDTVQCLISANDSRMIFLVFNQVAFSL